MSIAQVLQRNNVKS